MKKLLLSVAVLFTAILTTNAEETLLASEVFQSASGTEQTIANDSIVGNFTIKATSSKTVGYDLNSAYFNADLSTVTSISECTNYTTRIKTKGASVTTSGSEARVIIFNAPSAGTLKFAARTATAADTRTITITQGSSVLLTQDVVDTQAVEVENSESSTGKTKVFPYYSVAVPAAGNVVISTSNGINFYEVSFSTGTNAIKSTSVNKAVANIEYYTVLGQKTNASAKGLIIEKTIYADGTSSSAKVLK